VNAISRFGRFWLSFVVGDDWAAAAAIAAAIAATAILAATGRAAWWILPVAVPLTVCASLRRAVAG
jgi:hypothetical protein